MWDETNQEDTSDMPKGFGLKSSGQKAFGYSRLEEHKVL